MQEFEYTDNNGMLWVRVTKARARKLFTLGSAIWLCDGKNKPGITGVRITSTTVAATTENFERFCSAYESYCIAPRKNRPWYLAPCPRVPNYYDVYDGTYNGKKCEVFTIDPRDMPDGYIEQVESLGYTVLHASAQYAPEIKRYKLIVPKGLYRFLW